MPSGALKYGSFVSPKVNAKLHCSAILFVFSQASGTIENSSYISSVLFR